MIFRAWMRMTFVFLLSGMPAASLLGQPQAQQIFDRARQTYSKTRAFEANLDIRSYVGEHVVRFAGVLKLKSQSGPKVSLMLMTEDQSRCVAFYLSDGTTEWSYDPGDRHITQTDLSKGNKRPKDGPLEKFLPDFSQYDRESLRFDEIQPKGEDEEIMYYVVEAKRIQKRPRDVFPYAKFTVSSKDWLLRELSLLDDSRRVKMWMRFLDVRRDQEIPDAAFQFRFPEGLPEGVEVRVLNGNLKGNREHK